MGHMRIFALTSSIRTKKSVYSNGINSGPVESIIISSLFHSMKGKHAGLQWIELTSMNPCIKVFGNAFSMVWSARKYLRTCVSCFQ